MSSENIQLKDIKFLTTIPALLYAKKPCPVPAAIVALPIPKEPKTNGFNRVPQEVGATQIFPVKVAPASKSTESPAEKVLALTLEIDFQAVIDDKPFWASSPWDFT